MLDGSFKDLILVLGGRETDSRLSTVMTCDQSNRTNIFARIRKIIHQEIARIAKNC